MKTPNVQLMIKAKEALRGMWGTAAVATLIYSLLAGATCWAAPIFAGPLTLGYIIFIRTIYVNRENAQIERIFDGFKDFVRSLIAYLLMSIYICLWMLLFIIPGIIMSFAYSMTFFILADDKTLTASQALKRSKEMMVGYKFKLFCLYLRFFGWILLGILSFGIAFFWIEPYMRMATYQFYLDIKNQEA